ncbi:zinc dependent phospholipase C family protein [Dyadobacter sp. CY343]|uniref:zinc dependent phospholipase C family protein n=1 Tax=Dyadobacter sp. CY343 TaxID=2907299 RepID=UPI001F38DA22|nr:zinc dependent phospholipase C family protein [Dyadobacter sp. CY343]MCE7059909.1 zinc dependent phospholipase C family protein [Dyadobacter sp. CY343]
MKGQNEALGSDIQWGFWAHKRINRMATFRLPPEMQVFYKKHIEYLTENATNPDKRRYAVVGEAERHFIDLDVYGDSALLILPKFWPAAVLRFGEDSLRKHGIVPWQIQQSAYQLTEAFKTKNPGRILKVSADLGHYVADAHVPLHTTRNYNGQLSGQEGIHGFWESRLPELFAGDYDLWIGPAEYCDNIAIEAWKIVRDSHLACDSVFLFEKELTLRFKKDEKYSYELRNNVLTRSYSREFSEKYHQMLAKQVERRMKAAVKLVGDIWYTCWVNAGQPDLREISGFVPGIKEAQEQAEEQKSWLQKLFNVRTESD